MAAAIVAAGGAPLRAQEASSEAAAEAPADPEVAPAVERGAYVFRASGCLACHTDLKNKGATLAGGRALKTPFGTFYSPNITPHPETGIGAWSEADFVTALRHGTSPAGDPYYPAFPYTSYSGMTDQDMADLYAYLMAQPAVDQANKDHELGFPYNLRFSLGIWQALFFEAGAFQEDPGKSAAWNRGAYLVVGAGHCGECHTPRNVAGAMIADRALSGAPNPDGDGVIPNITPDPETGIGSWSEDDLIAMFETGFTPEFDSVGGSMAPVQRNLSKLSAEDRAAMAAYLKSIPAIRSEPEAAPAS